MERTVVDWMFEHPYLATMIVLAFFGTISDLGEKAIATLKKFAKKRNET